MYDRFGATRVDDGLVSTKHLLTHSSAQISTATINLNLSNNNNNNEIETPTLELETNRKIQELVGISTPPRSPRGSHQAFATLSGSEQKTSTTITTTTTSYRTITTNQISDNIRGLLEPVSASAAANHQQQATTTSSPVTVCTFDNTSPSPEPSASQVYQLRALTGNKIEEEEQSKHQYLKHLDVDTLSLNLIEETLNYFISCKHRLGQITKTFDDSNALIMLLQEKEEDLEVVGQLGQDLLRRYNELREAYEGQRQELAQFQEELAKCREDNQQLKYDLASNKSLLDTFKEEEEHLIEEQNSSFRVCGQCQSTTIAIDDDGQPFSLRSQADRSLTNLENELCKQMCDLKDELMEVRERELAQRLRNQERALQLEMQLRDTEMRQSDLESENETLRDQQRELQQVIETQSRRFDELLRIFGEYQHEQSRLYNLESSRNISTINYQAESSPSLDSQLNSLLFLDQSHYQNDTQHHPINHHRNHSSTCPTTTTLSSHEYQQQQQQQQLQNQQIVRPIVRQSSSSNMVTSTSLHEEMLESMYKSGMHSQVGLDESNSDDNDDDLGQGGQMTSRHSDSDSGLQTRNISSSTTPVNSCLDADCEIASSNPTSPTDSNSNTISEPDDSSIDRFHCRGISTFTMATLLLLILSATLNSSTNSNLAQKLQQINLNQ